jgi:hypothetical protein
VPFQHVAVDHDGARQIAVRASLLAGKDVNYQSARGHHVLEVLGFDAI